MTSELRELRQWYQRLLILRAPTLPRLLSDLSRKRCKAFQLNDTDLFRLECKPCYVSRPDMSSYQEEPSSAWPHKLTQSPLLRPQDGPPRNRVGDIRIAAWHSARRLESRGKVACCCSSLRLFWCMIPSESFVRDLMMVSALLDVRNAEREDSQFGESGRVSDGIVSRSNNIL